MSKHQYETGFTLASAYTGDGPEFEVIVTFDYSPGYPATGPSWSSPGEPGEGPSVDFDYRDLAVYRKLPDGTRKKVEDLPSWFLEELADSILEHETEAMIEEAND